ncbi:DUF2752 domain-containing protein [Zhouia spongiae]|uniref:DUF2752 domain-containing protein n=1 Tax=Zhouia spongiae TaxID=2202721 RepID=UPI003BFA6C51
MATTRFKIFIYCIIGIICLSGLSLYFFIDPGTSQIDIFPECPFHALTGLHCPGCGTQRAIHDYLNGNIIDGIKHNLLVPVVVFLILYKCYVYLFKKLYNREPENNILEYSKLSLIVLVLVLSFWILRNIPTVPFCYLAP